MWGVEGNGNLKEELLNPYDLHCHGGSSNEKGMAYRIYHKTNGFEIYLIENEIVDIGKYYTKYLREKKLKRITK